MLASAYLTLYYVRPQRARAARAERRAARVTPAASSGAPLPGAASSSEPPGYAALLGAAYVFAPVLALVSWRGLAPLLPGSAAVAVAGALLLLLPPLIHVAHGATARGGLALASLVGYVGFGSVSGAVIGRTLADVSCDAQTHDECGLSLLGGLLLGAAVGGLLGYCAHGVRQVLVERRKQSSAELIREEQHELAS
ncbi:MAG: hypothetical protein RL685_5056 [Pseudomonadota bacterium]|jgi:hypothetical protein